MHITIAGITDTHGVMEVITVDIMEVGEVTITLDIMVDGGIPPTTEITGITIPIGVIQQLHAIRITTKRTEEKNITADPEADQVVAV